MNNDVTLIIPILNEGKTINKTLLSIQNQMLRPKELIFVDAGSNDKTLNIIENWWSANAWIDGEMFILHSKGSLPGAGRNLGIKKAKSQKIAFLDSGIVAERDWIFNLVSYLKNNNCLGVWGVCEFYGNCSFQKAIAALSYGQGAEHHVLPASLFDKKVFEEIGLFENDLRAYEDLVWGKKFIDHYNVKHICKKAKVRYEYFPITFYQIFRKWEVAGFDLVKSNYNNKLIYLVIFFLFTLILILFLYPRYLLPIFITYLLLRVLLDTARRSKSQFWWKNDIRSLLYAVLIAPVMDCSKILGIFKSIIERYIK